MFRILFAFFYGSKKLFKILQIFFVVSGVYNSEGMLEDFGDPHFWSIDLHLCVKRYYIVSLMQSYVKECKTEFRGRGLIIQYQC